MKRFKVYWNNSVDVNFADDFDTLEEAKKYCADNTKEYDKVSPEDNNWEGRGNNSHYEIYDGEYEIVNEDGEVEGINDPVFMTDQYYL